MPGLQIGSEVRANCDYVPPEQYLERNVIRCSVGELFTVLDLLEGGWVEVRNSQDRGLLHKDMLSAAAEPAHDDVYLNLPSSGATPNPDVYATEGQDNPVYCNFTPQGGESKSDASTVQEDSNVVYGSEKERSDSVYGVNSSLAETLVNPQQSVAPAPVAVQASLPGIIQALDGIYGTKKPTELPQTPQTSTPARRPSDTPQKTSGVSRTPSTSTKNGSFSQPSSRKPSLNLRKASAPDASGTLVSPINGAGSFDDLLDIDDEEGFEDISAIAADTSEVAERANRITEPGRMSEHDTSSGLRAARTIQVTRTNMTKFPTKSEIFGQFFYAVIDGYQLETLRWNSWGKERSFLCSISDIDKKNQTFRMSWSSQIASRPVDEVKFKDLSRFLMTSKRMFPFIAIPELHQPLTTEYIERLMEYIGQHPLLGNSENLLWAFLCSTNREALKDFKTYKSVLSGDDGALQVSTAQGADVTDSFSYKETKDRMRDYLAKGIDQLKTNQLEISKLGESVHATLKDAGSLKLLKSLQGSHQIFSRRFLDSARPEINSVFAEPCDVSHTYREFANKLKEMADDVETELRGAQSKIDLTVRMIRDVNQATITSLQNVCKSKNENELVCGVADLNNYFTYRRENLHNIVEIERKMILQISHFHIKLLSRASDSL